MHDKIANGEALSKFQAMQGSQDIRLSHMYGHAKAGKSASTTQSRMIRIRLDLRNVIHHHGRITSLGMTTGTVISPNATERDIGSVLEA